MTVVSGQIGSYSGTYYEYFDRDIQVSPRSDLRRPPFAYNRWLPYSFNKWSYRGCMVKVSNGSDAAPPYRHFSSWDLGCSTSNVSATHGSKIKALSKLVDVWKNSDVNLGVSIGEGKESLGMVTDTLFSLVQSARAIRRGDLGGAVRHFKNPVPRRARKKAAKRLSQGDLSGSWLALNLGWAPMISDIYSALGYVQYDGGYAKIASGWVKGSANALVNTVNGMGGRVTKRDARLRYVTAIKTPPTEWQRLGLTNPALIAWELVPFSFVVDYFANIGDGINALSVFQMDNSSVKTFLEERVDIKTKYPSRPKGSWLGGWYAAEATQPTFYRYRSYRRTVVSLGQQWVAGSIEYRLPTSIKKLANMAGLLHQSLLNLKR